MLVCSERGNAQATARIDNPQLLMGKTAGLVVSVPVSSDSARVEFPLLQQALSAKRKYVPLLNDTVEILTKFTRSEDFQDKEKWVRYHLTLQAFDSGNYTLPPFEFIVDGEKIESNKVDLSVIPVKATAEDPIEPFDDIVEPFDVNPNPEELEESDSFLWWLIPLAVILLGLIIYLYIRFKKTGRILLLSKPLPPYAVALNKLRKLQAQNLPQKGKTKEYYTKLTDILRSYINRQFKIKTFEKTSAEILIQISNDDHLSKYEGVLKSIFETSDFVKFAKVQPSVVENSRCLTEAERFIEASHPVEDNTKKNESEKKGGIK